MVVKTPSKGTALYWLTQLQRVWHRHALKITDHKANSLSLLLSYSLGPSWEVLMWRWCWTISPQGPPSLALSFHSPKILWLPLVLSHQDHISKYQLEPQQIASGQFNANGRYMQVSNLVSLFDTLSILTPLKKGVFELNWWFAQAVDLLNFKQCSKFLSFLHSASALFPLVNCMHVCVSMLE